MNYTAIDNRPFIASKEPLRHVKMSEQTKKRKIYIESHQFSVTYDIQTSQPVVKVTKKDER